MRRPSTEAEYHVFALFRGDNLTLTRSIWLALYGIAFVFICNLALARNSAPWAHPIYGSLADPTYVTLIALTLLQQFYSPYSPPYLQERLE
jgi:hypothetical protein